MTLIFKFRIRELMLEPTTDVWVQLFRSVFVGALAFLVDAGVLFLLEKVGLHYLAAAAISFIFGLVFNFLLSKKVVFSENTAKMKGAGEFIVFGLIGAVGLLLTEGLMYLLTETFGLYFMLSKVVAAVIVLFWNFSARKFILYRE